MEDFPRTPAKHHPQQDPTSVSAGLVAALLVAVTLLVARNAGVFSLPRGGSIEPHAITPRGDLASDEKSTIEIFRNASPCVVNITTLSVAQDRLTRRPLEIPEGTGSGFIWDKAGHVVTNFHVIKKAQAARVTLADKSSWEARLVGVDPDVDLAVLRIDAPDNKLSPIPIGESHNLQVGQKVFAIGNPFGLDQTLTTGVISGLGREIASERNRTIEGVIQTDAAINPGNSGGPLLDSAGRLIGVNTAIYSPSGASAGIGFAIPVDRVNLVVPELVANGRVQRVGLGIQPVDDTVTRYLGIANGVLIQDFSENSAGEAAGLIPTFRDQSGRIIVGDVIVGINDKTIRGTNDLLRAMLGLKVGEPVEVTVERGGRTKTLTVTLQAVN